MQTGMIADASAQFLLLMGFSFGSLIGRSAPRDGINDGMSSEVRKLQDIKNA